MPIGASLLSIPPRPPAPSARGLLAILIIGTLIVLVGPLTFELFFAIPWPIRKSMGWALVLALAGLGIRRLWEVKPSDSWVTGCNSSAGTRGERWLPWVLQAVVASLAMPLLTCPGALGFGDWDFHLERFEAIRRVILAGQFPWWTPWCRGGFPLASDPQCGVVSIATPLVVLLGTGTGLRLATIVYLMIAVEGARRLARSWIDDPWAAVAAGLIYGINGGVLVYTVAGHFIPMSYCALPWLLHSVQRLGSRPAEGYRLGFWMAFNLLSGVQYPSIYALAIAAVVWVRALRMQPAHRLGTFACQTVAALATCLALAGWRIATTLLVLSDFPREHHSNYGFTLWELTGCAYYRPDLLTLQRATSTHAWESVSYIGPVAAILALASLRTGWRWWHTLVVLCTWLALGETHWYQPSYWLSQGPVFRSMHVVTRWRIPVMLGLGLAAGQTIAQMRARGRLLRALAVIAVGTIALDYLAYGHAILPLATSIAPSEDQFPGPPTATLVNVENGLGFPAILRGYGVIRGYEPLLGYDRSLPTARLWRGHPEYRGEAWTDDRELVPVSWTPNRVVYQAEPGQVIHLNVNPGSWWRVNDAFPFAGWRCAEWQRQFDARADARGRLELEVVPRGRSLGLSLHVAGLVLLAGYLVHALREHRRLAARGSAADHGPGG